MLCTAVLNLVLVPLSTVYTASYLGRSTAVLIFILVFVTQQYYILGHEEINCTHKNLTIYTKFSDAIIPRFFESSHWFKVGLKTFHTILEGLKF